MKSEEGGFTNIAYVMSDVIKEITRRAELRPRLEAEMGRRLPDHEFLIIADATGIKL